MYTCSFQFFLEALIVIFLMQLLYLVNALLVLATISIPNYIPIIVIVITLYHVISSICEQIKLMFLLLLLYAAACYCQFTKKC